MHDFTQIARILEKTMNEMLQVMNISSHDSLLIYDPVIGVESLAELFQQPDKSSPRGLNLGLVQMCREKRNDEYLPAPLVLQFHVQYGLSMMTNTYSLYYDVKRQQVFFRTATYLSDRDVYHDYSVTQWLRDIKHGIDWNMDSYVKRYATRDGDALYQDVGYTDMIVTLASSEICNI